jgi:diguanylate cyclase (GGDEF)-like protein
LLLLDLDGFKQVNDRFGHDVGDKVLVAVGETLLGCVRESDTVARLGGDELVVLLGNLGAPIDEAALVTHKVIERLSAPQLIQGLYLAVVPSVGIALFGSDGSELDELLKSADRAMYEAKQAGGGAVRFSVRESAQQYQLRLQG